MTVPLIFGEDISHYNQGNGCDNLLAAADDFEDSREPDHPKGNDTRKQT